MSKSPSRHNIVSKLRGRDEDFVVNLLTGSADLLSAQEAVALRGAGAVSDGAASALAERGYLVDPLAEHAEEERAYRHFLETRATDEVQLFFAPTYACNFACSYCYQSEYPAIGAAEQAAVIRSFFAYVDEAFAGRRTYLTLFGGEPLLDGQRTREAVSDLIDGAAARGLDVAVVTNGFTLTSYLDTLARAKLREIQITLDGTAALHDARRPLKGGGSTFERVVAGVDATLARDIPVNLRVVVDRENLAGLPELARFAKERGWTRHPRFKTQLGRNYELHYCQVGTDRLYSRLELHEALYTLVRQHPEVLELHRPAFSVSRTLVERGTLPEPLFDACPGCKTEWAFDTSGRIYPCTATVGKPGEDVGSFHPKVELHAERVGDWQGRDVRSIPECRGCAEQLACGGGCASVAKNASGRVRSPDCRPITKTLELGLALYGAGQGASEAEACCTPEATACCTPASRGRVSMSLLLIAALAIGPVGDIPERDRDGRPHLQSESAVVRLADTGELLLQKNPAVVRPIASVTKLLSGLVLAGLEVDPTLAVTIGEQDKDRRKWSRSRLFVGLTAPWAQLAQAALSASDNRAMYAVARVAAPEGDFTERMNQRARELGMASSRFVDPAGVDPANVSTARDLLELLSATAEDERVRAWATAPSLELETGRGAPLQLYNPDRLVHLASWDVVIGKTGYTVEAGRTLVVRVRLQGRPVDMVFLGSREWASVFGDAGRVRRWLEPRLVREAAAAAACATAPAPAPPSPPVPVDACDGELATPGSRR